jgi:hypothetical protein
MKYGSTFARVLAITLSRTSWLHQHRRRLRHQDVQECSRIPSPGSALVEGGRTFLRRRDQIGPPEGKKEENCILVVECVSRCPRCGLDEPTCACLEYIQMQPHMGQLLELLIQGDLR